MGCVRTRDNIYLQQLNLPVPMRSTAHSLLSSQQLHFAVCYIKGSSFLNWPIVYCSKNICSHCRLWLIVLHNCGHTKDVLHSTVDYKNFVALVWKLAENVNKISQDYCPITYLKHSTFQVILIGRVLLLLSTQGRREGMTTRRGACGGGTIVIKWAKSAPFHIKIGLIHLPKSGG